MGGRSADGRRAAASHTGALASEQRVVDAFFARHGIWRARSVAGLVDAAELYLQGWSPQGRRLAVVSNSGATCVLSADAAQDHGLPLAEFSADTVESLTGILPSFATKVNPVDITAALLTDSSLFGRVLPALGADPGVDACLIGIPVSGSGYDVPRFAADAAAFAQSDDKPVVVSTPQPPVAEQFRKAGLVVFEEESSAIAALAQLLHHAELMQTARSMPPSLAWTPAPPDGASPQTIRRDLNEMAEARLIARVHGGAIVASSVQNLAYDARKLVAQPHKRLIGEATARLIADNSSMFINIGTTTEEVARALAGRSGLLVITNNLNVAAELYRNRNIDVIITGGSVRPNDGGIVGAAAVDVIRQFRVDTAVIGISAIDADGTLLDFDIREVQVARAIIGNSRRVILVADSSKFSRSAPALIGTLADIDILVTDQLASPAIAALCRAHDVEVVEAGGPRESEPSGQE